MKQTVILVGGGDSYSKREDFLLSLHTQTLRDLPTNTTATTNWRQSLVESLSNTHVFYIPTMPNKQNAHYDEWKIWFERYLDVTKGDLVLIGYSLGGLFLLKYLSENNIARHVKQLFLLASPSGVCDDGTGNDCADFVFEPHALVGLTGQVGEIIVMHSQDDRVVPFVHARKLKDYLVQARLVAFEDKNHFLVEEFPELVKELRLSYNNRL